MHHLAGPESDILHGECNVLTDTGTGGGDVAIRVVRTLASKLVFHDSQLLAVRHFRRFGHWFCRRSLMQLLAFRMSTHNHAPFLSRECLQSSTSPRCNGLDCRSSEGLCRPPIVRPPLSEVGGLHSWPRLRSSSQAVYHLELPY
jgi:hypothetical protein